ncbi:MAG: copper amine oxidase N-terminal domain-containing protein [Defluviitaleaceae bacterium]|nr:copper amine oxidase N-terminal domain-containing protein [Defluviitaleaceae bacterium]
MKKRITYKRRMALIFILTAVFTVFPGVAVSAAPHDDEPPMIYVGTVYVEYTGFAILPDPNKPNHFALAVRPIAEAAGYTVTGSRNGAVLKRNGTALHAEGTEIRLWADRDDYVRKYPNGDESRHILAGTPFTHNGRLYLNADALAEMLGLVFIKTYDNAGESVWRFIQPNAAIEARYRRNNEIFQSFTERHGGGFIYGQNREPVRGMRIGSRGNGGDHGCGPFAVYNVLRYLGVEGVTPASVIRFLDYNNGINLGGFGGTHPEVLTQYIRRAGFGADIRYLPEDMDGQIQSADAAILLYGRLRGGFFIHYVMVRYEANDTGPGRFYVYNEFGGDTRPRVYASVDALVIDRGYRTVALIII